MRVSAYLYPWDVDGDPSAAGRIADLGVAEVNLAAAYHAVRAVTPFHPRHRVVTRDAGVYYQPDPGLWRGSSLRPVAPGPADPPGRGAPDPAGSFERAADSLHAAGLKVNAWAVLTHNGGLGAAHPDCTVRNAYGDPYSWALCAASPRVAAYLATLSAEIAALGCVDGIELEACGWYGFDHGSAHDKTSGGPPGTPGWLLDLCFCPACADAIRAAGADPANLARQVRAVLDAGFRRVAAPPPGPEGSRLAEPGERAHGEGAPREGVPGNGLADSVPADVAELLSSVRAATAERLLRHVLGAVREAAPGKPVLVHSHPDAWQAGANPGFDPAVLLGPGGADGVVLSCQGPAAESARLVARTARAAAALPGTPRIAATLLAVTGLGGRTAELRDQAEAVTAAGAADVRLYHAGLASATDLACMRALT